MANPRPPSLDMTNVKEVSSPPTRLNLSISTSSGVDTGSQSHHTGPLSVPDDSWQPAASSRSLQQSCNRLSTSGVILEGPPTSLSQHRPLLTAVITNPSIYIASQRDVNVFANLEPHRISAFLCMAKEATAPSFLCEGTSHNRAFRELLPLPEPDFPPISFISHQDTCAAEIFVPSYTFSFLKIPLRDASDQKLQLDEAFAFINAMRGQQRNLVIYCQKGRSRSVSTLIAWMMHALRASYNGAFAMIKAARPRADPNPYFASQLKQHGVDSSSASSVSPSRAGSVNIGMSPPPSGLSNSVSIESLDVRALQLDKDPLCKNARKVPSVVGGHQGMTLLTVENSPKSLKLDAAAISFSVAEGSGKRESGELLHHNIFSSSGSSNFPKALVFPSPGAGTDSTILAIVKSSASGWYNDDTSHMGDLGLRLPQEEEEDDGVVDEARVQQLLETSGLVSLDDP